MLQAIVAVFLTWLSFPKFIVVLLQYWISAGDWHFCPSFISLHYARRVRMGHWKNSVNSRVPFDDLGCGALDACLRNIYTWMAAKIGVKIAALANGGFCIFAVRSPATTQPGTDRDNENRTSGRALFLFLSSIRTALRRWTFKLLRFSTLLYYCFVNYLLRPYPPPYTATEST